MSINFVNLVVFTPRAFIKYHYYMHPILIITYIINQLFVLNVFGLLGIFLGILGSAAVFYFVSLGAGDNRKYWAQVLAVAFGHLVGLVAIYFAPWATPMSTGVAIIMELFVVAIFSMLGK